MLKTLNLLVPFLLLCLTSCVDYDFAEQDVAIAYRAEDDRLLVSIDTRGIYVDGVGLASAEDAQTKLNDAADRIRQMAAGRRYFYVLTWPLLFDLDDQEAAEAASKDAVEPAQMRLVERLSAARAGVSVTASKVYLDAAGEVSVRQRVEVENAQAMIAAVNDAMNMSVLKEMESTAAADASKPIAALYESEESRQRLLRFARADERWLVLDEDGMTVRIPITPDDLARLVKLTAEAGGELDGNSERFVAVLRAALGDMTRLSVEGEVASLRFPFGEDGRIDMAYRTERKAGAARVRAQFTDDELK